MLSSRKDLLEKLVSNIDRYSPIVVKGESGIGKSHFVRELCHRLQENGTVKEYKACYAWEFIDSMIEALCKQRMAAWKSEFLTADMIVIDDLQYAQGKEATTAVLYQIFSSFNKPIVVASSLPICLENFPNTDLVQFLNEGTSIELNSPTPEDIAEFLSYQIKENNLHLSPQAYAWLTQQKINSLTTAKGIIKTLQLYQENEYITLANCQRLVRAVLFSTKNE